jgi:hypothetical protein
LDAVVGLGMAGPQVAGVLVRLIAPVLAGISSISGYLWQRATARRTSTASPRP